MIIFTETRQIMRDFIIEKYKNISRLTYYNFDVYYYSAIKKVMGNYLSVKDLNFLIFINSYHPSVTPTTLSKAFYVSMNNVSNRLKLLEDNSYIKRDKAVEDTRQTVISITDQGKQLIAFYSQFMEGYIKYLRKNISALEYLQILSAVKKLKRLMQNNNYNKMNQIPATTKLLDSIFLIEISNYFALFEQRYIEELSLDLKQNDLFILTELYIHVSEGKLNLQQLADSLYIPYQTLVSKVNKYIKLDYLVKDKTIMFNDAIQTVIEKYMMMRTIIYFDTMNSLNEKETNVVLKMFDQLKEFSLKSLA